MKSFIIFLATSLILLTNFNDGYSQGANLDGVKDFVTFPKTTEYDLGTGPFTVEMSFTKTNAGRSDLFSFKENAANDFGIFIDADLRFKVYLNLGNVLQGSSGIVIQGGTAVTIGAEHHVAVTRDASGNWTLYLDGVIDGTGASSGDLDLIANPPFILLGANHNNLTPCCFYHQGTIDEFRVWNIARSQADISSSMSSVSPSSTGLIGYYDFATAECGVDIDDLTTAGNNATLGGCPIPVPDTVPSVVFCGFEGAVDNRTTENNIEVYSTRSGFAFLGNERVVQLPASECGEVCITVSNRTPAGQAVDLFVLTDPTDGGTSVLWINGNGGTTCFTPIPGTSYYLSIDGLGGSQASFDLSVACGDDCDPDPIEPDFAPCTAPMPEEFMENLVSYWNFDDNTDDLIGVNNGAIVGTGFSYVPAQFGNGIDLDGGTTYIDAGMDASLNMAGKSATFSAWFRVDDFTGSWQALLSKGEGNAYRIARFSNTSQMSYNGGAPDITHPAQVDDGQFHHVVAVTEDGAYKALYLDGVLVSVSTSGTSIGDNGQPLFIGENPQARNREWNGVIDEVAIWDKALTECQVERLYAAGLNLTALTTPAEIVPTMSEWGVILLFLFFLIIGVVAIRQKSEYLSKREYC